tara:strand:- start:1858 stop:3048 length:1191 start_codon:yes stop_codon:yes gene_type:complete
VPAPAPGEGATGPEPENDRPDGLAFTGRFIDPDGRPVSGVEFFVVRFIHDDGKEPEPWGWSNLSTVSGADGRFWLSTSLYPNAQIEVAARHPDWLELHWPFMSFEHARRAELGDIQLERPGQHQLFLEDGEGEPIQESWFWIVTSERIDLADEADPTHFIGFGASVDGVLTLGGLPIGSSATVRLHPLSNDQGPQRSKVEHAAFEVDRDEVGTSVVVFDDRSEESGSACPPIVLMPERATMRVMRLEPNSIEVLGPDGKAILVHLVDGLVVASPKHHGPHHVRVVDSRFDAWERTDVRPGEWFQIGLDGSAAMHVVGTDTATLERLAGSSAWFSIPGVWSHFIGWRTGEFYQGLVIDHLVPGPVDLTIEYADGTSETLPTVDMGPRDQVEVLVGPR